MQTRVTPPSLPPSTAIMSRFYTADSRCSQHAFAFLPKVREDTPGVPQLKGSLRLGSAPSHTTGVCVSHLQEADLVTGAIDITHERVHMLPATRDDNRAGEKKDMVCAYLSPADNRTSLIRSHQEQYIISLKIIPSVSRRGWGLDHDSNIVLRASRVSHPQRLSNEIPTGRYPPFSTSTMTLMQLF